VPQDYADPEALCRTAATGQVKAQYALVSCTAWAREKSDQEAVNWWQRQLRIPGAQYYPNLYEIGGGVKQE
jgi:hypothetical protein